MATRAERVQWLDRAVSLTLLASRYPWRTVAGVRQSLDNLAAAYAAEKGGESPARAYMDANVRARTAQVRRSVRRLASHGLAEESLKIRALDPSEALVEHYRISPAGRVRAIDGELAASTDDELEPLRLLFAGLCEHSTQWPGCLACEGFVAAGGDYETKEQDLVALLERRTITADELEGREQCK